MDIFEAITGRRNIKLFRPDAIDEATWMKWLEAASYAPNHRMNQPWQVIVIGDEARVKINHKPNFGDAPLVLAFVAEGQTNRLSAMRTWWLFRRSFRISPWLRTPQVLVRGGRPLGTRQILGRFSA